MRQCLQKEPSIKGKPFTSDAEDAVEEHTTLGKNDVQLAAMGHRLELDNIHGKLEN